MIHDPEKPPETNSTPKIYGSSFDISAGLRKSFPIWYESEKSVAGDRISTFLIVLAPIVLFFWST